MRRISLLFALIPLCVPVAVARAWVEPPTADDARLGRFLPLARAAWPGSPCAGREVVHLAATARLATEAPALTTNPGDMLEGMAAPATCEVWMAAGLDTLQFCVVLVHEFGHLAGRDHDHVPGDVMNGDDQKGYDPCDQDVTPPAHVLLDDQMRALLPSPRAAWRISCGPRRAGERHCVARRAGRVRRFYVSQTRDAVTVVDDS
jgi:hypothetical protein